MIDLDPGPTRMPTHTVRVRTSFGSWYCHICHDGAGKAIAVTFSTPGRFAESTVADALDQLAAGINEGLATIGGAK